MATNAGRPDHNYRMSIDQKIKREEIANSFVKSLQVLMDEFNEGQNAVKHVSVTRKRYDQCVVAITFTNNDRIIRTIND